jgi:hypothetical protein
MYRKNTAGQFVCFQMLLTATGAVATGLSPAVRRCLDGTFAAGGGTVTEDSAGFYKYALAQADTNANDCSFMFSAATAMPVCVNIVTTAADPTDAAAFGLTTLTAINAKTTNLPASPAAVSDIPTAIQNADALLDRTAGIETNRTVRQGLRLMLSALAGKLSGAATTTVTIRDTNDGKDRIVATVDSNGNRSAVTLDAS